MKTAFRLIAAGMLAVGAMSAHAGDDDDKKRGCKLSTLKGTYAFSNYAQLLAAVPPYGLSIPIAFGGQIHFPGDGTVKFQTSDYLGFGSGAAPHLTTVAGTVTQIANNNGANTATTGCAYDVAVTLLVTGDNCPLDVHLNVFADEEGEEFHALTTAVSGAINAGGLGNFYSAFEADRVSKKNTLVDLPLSTQGTCGNPA